MSFINEAGWDRMVRIVLGVVLVYLGFSGTVEGGWGIFLGVFGFIPLVTGLVGWCPLYAIFRVRTKQENAGV